MTPRRRNVEVLAPPCRECRRPATRSPGRGLCVRCHEIPACRRKWSNSSGPLDQRIPHPTRPDPKPCPHPPGTVGKIRCLAMRAEKGYYLYHPGDCRRELVKSNEHDEPTPLASMMQPGARRKREQRGRVS